MTAEKVYEKYGTYLTTVEAKKEIEGLIYVDFVEHESLYFGSYYSTKPSDSQEIICIKNNVDPFDNEKIEDCDFTVIVYIDNVLTGDNQIIAQSKNFTFLERTFV